MTRDPILPPPSSSPDDSSAVDRRTVAIATAVAELVDPVKQVLGVARSALLTTRLAVFIQLVLCAGLAFVLWQQATLLGYIRQNAIVQRSNTAAVATLLGKLDNAAQDVADVKEEVETIPRIVPQPADTADPTSRPAAVLRQRPPRPRRDAGSKAEQRKRPPPPTRSIEIPIDLGPKKR